ncbi:hypothetical protein ACHAWU_003964 [Discostella pseudostelligera]|uniref:CRAL-TRIO domain-containing protein n=1 Tax=Discostella pseudostelligera TaxID=259834 RepID=A0ABD3MPL4_9STRA
MNLLSYHLALVLFQIQACIHIAAKGYSAVTASEVLPADSMITTCTDASRTCDDSATDADTDSKSPGVGGGQEQFNVDSPWQFMQAFTSLGTNWNHVIQEYISVVKAADGVDLQGDVYAQNMEDGLISLQTMVHNAKLGSNDDDWAFSRAPLADFGKTVDDVLLAFLRWSVVDNKASQDDQICKLIGGVNTVQTMDTHGINVSKAFRRLTSYIHWMQSVSTDLVDPPLAYESISPSLSTFHIHATHDSCNRLVWWVNLGKTDMPAFKSQSPRDTTRMFVWLAHLLFLDERAQQNGLVVIDDMAEIGFWTYMTMLPLHVGISVDRFLISVTPLKAKNVVLMHLPRWAEIGYGLLSWFLTAKMKSRVTIVSKSEEIETLEKIVGGASFIPRDFGDWNGVLESDIVDQYRNS